MVLLPFPGGNTTLHLHGGAHHQPCAGRDALRAGAATQAVEMLTYSFFSAFCIAAMEVLAAFPVPRLESR